MVVVVVVGVVSSTTNSRVVVPHSVKCVEAAACLPVSLRTPLYSRLATHEYRTCRDSRVLRSRTARPLNLYTVSRFGIRVWKRQHGRRDSIRIICFYTTAWRSIHTNDAIEYR